MIAELGEYAADLDPELARHAIRAVGKICLRLPGSAATAIERLIDLMGMDVSRVASSHAWPFTPPLWLMFGSTIRVIHIVARRAVDFAGA